VSKFFVGESEQTSLRCVYFGAIVLNSKTVLTKLIILQQDATYSVCYISVGSSTTQQRERMVVDSGM